MSTGETIQWFFENLDYSDIVLMSGVFCVSSLTLIIAAVLAGKVVQ